MDAFKKAIKQKTFSGGGSVCIPREVLVKLDKEQLAGYLKVFSGSKEKIADAFKELFGKEIAKSGIIEKEGDIIVIHDAFGRSGFDILLTQNKIGVDGPRGWNWGVRGWFGAVKPVKELNSTAIRTTKIMIENMARELTGKRATNVMLGV